MTNEVHRVAFMARLFAEIRRISLALESELERNNDYPEPADVTYTKITRLLLSKACDHSATEQADALHLLGRLPYCSNRTDYRLPDDLLDQAVSAILSAILSDDVNYRVQREGALALAAVDSDGARTVGVVEEHTHRKRLISALEPHARSQTLAAYLASAWHNTTHETGAQKTLSLRALARQIGVKPKTIQTQASAFKDTGDPMPFRDTRTPIRYDEFVAWAGRQRPGWASRLPEYEHLDLVELNKPDPAKPDAGAGDDSE